ncbi:ATP-binding protein [Lentzea sp. NPDC060358]|uniref:ATP-binding protein n=1 Tax=Lentzea sp. NPDC060358 TaxID=3347103 RepID=UPI003648637A
MTIELGDDHGELHRARALVRERLAGLPAGLAEDVVLVADELTSNALRHGRAPRRVRLVRGDGFVRFEAEDGSVIPARRTEGTTTGGRGMTLVHVLSTRWGQRVTEHGKVVWAEFDLA